jgi:hypothetical protein
MDTMFNEDVVLQMSYLSQVENAILRNGDNAKIFENAKADWLQNAAIRRALKLAPAVKPVPALTRKVALLEDKSIVLTFGPERVADGEFDLPPLPGPNPPGVTDVGPHNWGDIWAAGPLDTKPVGTVVEHQGHKLERVGSWGPFGGHGYYREVKV